jgi:hypothetical protein
VATGEHLQARFDAAISGDTLCLAPGTYAIENTLTVDKDLSIVGAGAGLTTLKGNGAPVFLVESGKVTLASLTVRDGYTPGGGAGIGNLGDLTVTDCVVTRNVGLQGGGINNSFSATMTLSRCVISENDATQAGGGIWNVGSLSMIECDVSDNGAESVGAGLFNDGSVSMQGCRFSGNRATNGGGGMFQFGSLSTLTLDGTEVSGNTAGEGGGIYSVAGAVTLRNGSSVHDNEGGNCGGSGAYNGSGCA